MRLGLLAVSISLMALAILASSPPLAPVALGMLILGGFFLLDWSLQESMSYAAFGMEDRMDEIEADFYDFKNARWRYALAIVISVAMAVWFGLSRSDQADVIVIASSGVLFILIALVSIIRSRGRVLRRE